MTILRSAGSTLAFLITGTVALAQGSSRGATTYAPLPVLSAPGEPGTTTMSLPSSTLLVTITGTAKAYSSGSVVTSSVTGQPVARAAVQNVGTLIEGGGVAAAASVVAALTNAGAPAGPTSDLTRALVDLAGVNSGNAQALAAAAVSSFDSFVTSTSQAKPAFFAPANLPAQFLAIHAALTTIRAAMK